jgi:FkbM family methyltransferase
MVVFDVGANNGSSCISYAENPENTVYAFEPTPYLLKTYLYPRQSKNYIVVPKAVSDTDGEATFNIAGFEDWGCSSLYEFSDGLDKTWVGRDSFKVTEKVTVETIRMDTFIEQNNIESVDFFHCDAQGNDFTILQSFGKYLDRIKDGLVEACVKNPVYRNINNKADDIVHFLVTNGFYIVSMKTNDYADPNEVNIHFKRCKE